jgi:hypothetical protein
MLKPFCSARRRIQRRPSWRGGVVRQVRQAVRKRDGRRLPTAPSFGTTEPGDVLVRPRNLHFREIGSPPGANPTGIWSSNRA